MTEKQKRIVTPKVMEAYGIEEEKRFRIAEYVLIDLKFKDDTLYSWDDLTKKWSKADDVMWKMLLDVDEVFKVDK